MSDPQLRIDWLNSLHAETEASKQIMAGAQLVIAGGVEGIKEAAEQQPELILDVITLLAKVIDTKIKQVNAITEMYLESADAVDVVLDIIKKD